MIDLGGYRAAIALIPGITVDEAKRAAAAFKRRLQQAEQAAEAFAASALGLQRVLQQAEDAALCRQFFTEPVAPSRPALTICQAIALNRDQS